MSTRIGCKLISYLIIGIIFLCTNIYFHHRTLNGYATELEPWESPRESSRHIGANDKLHRSPNHFGYGYDDDDFDDDNGDYDDDYDGNESDNDGASNSEDNDGRSKYGYRHPQRPFSRIIHSSHNCTITTSSREGDVATPVHLPSAVPHLILIGAQKSGTTSLQAIFDKHPNVVRPSFKRPHEPHFFDWDVKRRWINGPSRPSISTIDDESQLCQWRLEYSQFFDFTRLTNSSVVFEKTPTYMLFPFVPEAIARICVWEPKILATLRNPIDRAFSEFHMDKLRPSNQHAVFETLVQEEIDDFLHYGLLLKEKQDNNRKRVTLSLEEYIHLNNSHVSPFVFATSSLEKYIKLVAKYEGNRKGLLFRGLYAPLLVPWVEQFAFQDQMMIIQFEKFAKAEREGRTNLVEDILEFAGIEEGTVGEAIRAPPKKKPQKLVQNRRKRAKARKVPGAQQLSAVQQEQNMQQPPIKRRLDDSQSIVGTLAQRYMAKVRKAQNDTTEIHRSDSYDNIYENGYNDMITNQSRDGIVDASDNANKNSFHDFSHNTFLSRNGTNATNQTRRRRGRNKTPKNATTWRRKSDYDPMHVKTREYLAWFYQPFNEFLVDVLGEEWKDIWSEGNK